MHYIQAKVIITGNNQLNIYRGCSGGCICCESRYKNQGGYSFSDVEVKENAVELLEDYLAKKSPSMINMGSQFDSYQDIEKKLGLTRKSLELICKYKFGVSIKTKSNLILRDIDLIEEINNKAKAVIIVPINTYDYVEGKKLEPNCSNTIERLEIVKEFSKRGIKAVVLLEPIIPFVNDNRRNIASILEACSKAGAYGIINHGMGMVINPNNKSFIYSNLEALFPGIQDKYEMAFKNNDIIYSVNKLDLENYFNAIANSLNLITNIDELNELILNYEEKQLTLFDFL